jgi:large subunit ribosomal protein L32
MALPKYRISRARGRSRRAHWKLTLPGIVECPQCHQKKLTHRVCKHCGYYDGKLVVDMTEGDDKGKKKEKKEKDA